MNKMREFWVAAALCAAVTPGVANAQSFDVVGSRAAGMGGAFVGVADDATAVYWNPAGLAGGSYFSLVLDGGVRQAIPDDGLLGGKQSSFLLAASMPALGLSYYRLRNAVAGPDPLLSPIDGSATPLGVTGDRFVRVDTLVTHHAGVTFVQSLTSGIAVGSTLKLVRGIAGTRIGVAPSAEDALDAEDPQGRGTTRFDLDFGVMASGRRVKAGLTVRNVREPEFTSPEGQTLRLERQARAGLSYAVLSGLVVAADLDLLKVGDAFGERRDAAFGFEGRLAKRAWLRSGFRFNTLDDERGSRARRAITAGATYAATASIMLDALVISGADDGRGWGISARFVY